MFGVTPVLTTTSVSPANSVVFPGSRRISWLPSAS
jgi:hypothetical protein